MMVQAVQFVLFQQITSSIMKIKLFIFITILAISSVVFAQRPPMPPREGFPPIDDRKPFPPMRTDDHHQTGWQNLLDTNKNGKIEREEYKTAAEKFFKKQDKNNNGIFEEAEHPRFGRDKRQENEVPPFLFLMREEFNLNKEQYDEKVNQRFIMFDVNGDGVIDFEEVKSIHPPGRDGEGKMMPNPRTAIATFIGAELRFGDKVVKDAPFSAETIREESKRLFDGSLIKNESKGLIYRDGFGRTRQEQPFEFIGGFQVRGENNQPKRLVSIVDAVAGNGYSVDAESKTFFKYPMQENPPFPRKEPREAKTESLGTKNIEGVNAEGTRITHEIPVGKIGNDKPIYVVTEKWFSPELQIIILSKHSDPFIGEVVFKLVNIKLGEPAADLFKIPSDYKLQNMPKREGRKND
jgi:EF hand